MKEVYTEIEIAATAKQVWQVLVDFASYPDWNPFIRRITGEPKEGSKLEIKITTPSGTNRSYEPKVTKVEPEAELRWFGKIPGFLSGEHIFSIQEAGPGRVKFVHRELFSGLLTSFFGSSTDRDIKAGFEEMNRALKKRVEG